MKISWVLLIVLLAPLAAACTGGNSTVPVTPTPPPNPSPSPPPNPTSFPPITFIGAGDIADCSTTVSGANAEATARLVDRISDGVVFTAGDNAYFNGTAAEFSNCY